MVSALVLLNLGGFTLGRAAMVAGDSHNRLSVARQRVVARLVDLGYSSERAVKAVGELSEREVCSLARDPSVLVRTGQAGGGGGAGGGAAVAILIVLGVLSSAAAAASSTSSRSRPRTVTKTRTETVVKKMCPACGGKGKMKCSKCKGNGTLKGIYDDSGREVKCRDCGGSGHQNKDCTSCKGSGYVVER